MNGFSERLSSCLRQKHMSQKILAEKLRVTPTAVSGFVNGRYMPSDRTITDICRVLSINEKWLRSGEGDMEIETPETFTAELTKQYGLAPVGAKLINALAYALAELNEEQQERLTARLLSELKPDEPINKANITDEDIRASLSIVDPADALQNTSE